MRYRHYSLSTERAYLSLGAHLSSAFTLRHLARWGGRGEAFLSHLANTRAVSASTHRQAPSALLFLYREVLKIDLPFWLNEIGRPQVDRRLPVVLTMDEVQRMLAALTGVNHLLTALLYGTGMRIPRRLRLRVKDVDFDHGVIIVRDGKGRQGSVVMLPQSLNCHACANSCRRRRLYGWGDREAGVAGVELPRTLARKVSASARELGVALGLPAGNAFA